MRGGGGNEGCRGCCGVGGAMRLVRDGIWGIGNPEVAVEGSAGGEG